MEAGVPFLLTIEFNGGTELLRLAARLQIVARKYGIKPTWLVGADALRHPSSLEPLARWQREGEAEVGAWLDAEAVPPLVVLEKPGRPFLTDFPGSVMEEKLTWFTQNLEKTFDHKPVTIRAARPAVDDRYYALLAKLGYRVDLTVVPHSKIETSDFTGYSEKPYMTPQGVLEVPRTVRKRRYGPFIEDLLTLPGLVGTLAKALFPTLRCLRLRQGNRPVVKRLLLEAQKNPPEHLDLRVSAKDWPRGDALVRDLEKTLASLRGRAQGLSAEELYQRFKNEQLRKGLL